MASLVSNPRFFKYVDECEPEACWEWLGARDKLNYGIFKLSNGKSGGRSIRAYRMAWIIYNERQPKEGLVIAHLCENPICVNPKHLIEQTQAENLAYMRRHNKCRKGHDLALAYVTKQGKRQCRECRRERRMGL